MSLSKRESGASTWETGQIARCDSKSITELHIRVGELNAAVVAEKLRLAAGVVHHFAGEGVAGDQGLRQRRLENAGDGTQREFGLLVTEEYGEVRSDSSEARRYLRLASNVATEEQWPEQLSRGRCGKELRSKAGVFDGFGSDSIATAEKARRNVYITYKNSKACLGASGVCENAAVFLAGNELPFHALVRVVQVEFTELHIRHRFGELHAAVVAEQLRLAAGVLHHFAGERIVGDQGLRQRRLENAGNGTQREFGLFVTEKNAEGERRQKQVEVGLRQPMVLHWQRRRHRLLLHHCYAQISLSNHAFSL
nr:hypothetical protein Iba_chr14aCG2360 [Ipomoea batatas]